MHLVSHCRSCDTTYRVNERDKRKLAEWEQTHTDVMHTLFREKHTFARSRINIRLVKLTPLRVMGADRGPA